MHNFSQRCMRKIDLRPQATRVEHLMKWLLWYACGQTDRQTHWLQYFASLTGTINWYAATYDDSEVKKGRLISFQNSNVTVRSSICSEHNFTSPTERRKLLRSACLYVCLAASISQKPDVQTSPNMLYKFPTAVARLSSGDVAIVTSAYF